MNFFYHEVFQVFQILVCLLCKNCNPPPLEKLPPSLFPTNPRLKILVLATAPPPLFENLVGGSTPSQQKWAGGGLGEVHTMI